MSGCMIITAAVHYEEPDLRVFLRSAARHVSHAAVLVFSEKTDGDFRRSLEADNPRVLLVAPPDAKLRQRMWRSGSAVARLHRLSALRRATYAAMLRTTLWPRASAALHVVMARHFWTRSVLRQPVTRGFDRFLLCDSSDICFQADPFEAVQERLIAAPSGRSYAQWPGAIEWYARNYTPEFASMIRERPMIVAGATLGPRSLIEAYTEAMVREISSRARNLFGRRGDQFLHNALLHRSGKLALRISSIDEGLMLHMLYADPASFIVNSNGVRTLEGKAIALLHHYDHSPAMAAHVLREYGGATGRKIVYKEKVNGRTRRLRLMLLTADPSSSPARQNP